MAPLDGPTAFLTKTYQLVDDHSVDHIISWTDDGSNFVIWQPGDFAQYLLPQKFKHNNLSSFIRQLSAYGFKKISPDRWEFSHEFFRRGQENLLCRINRQKGSPAAASASSDLKGSTTEMMEENEQLKKENARLTSENEKMKSLCGNIQHLVSNYSLGSGSVGSRLEAEPTPTPTNAGGRLEAEPTTAGGEGSRNIDTQVEAPLGSEESEFYPEEELSLRLSLAKFPNKRACNDFFRPPTSQN